MEVDFDRDRLIGKRVYVDSNVFIYALEGADLLRNRALSVIRLMDGGQVEAVTSSLSLAEVLVRSIKENDQSAASRFERLL